MHETNLRRVGGSVMLAVPPAILDLLNLRAGAPVSLTVLDDKLVIQARPSLRYSLVELLAASDYGGEQPLEEREWVDARAVGRETL